MAALNNVITYSGNGQQGVWTDPANWTGGKIPGPTSSALITKSAVLNGPIEVSNLMLLGQENVAINGAVKTDSTNTCESFMVCEGAVATLNAGATLNSAGGFICGIDNVGTTTIAGAAGGKAAAVLNTVDMKIGQFADGTGTVNVSGVLNVLNGGYIGLAGAGVMNVAGAGHANFSSLTLGKVTGGAGTLNLSGTSAVNVNQWLIVGTSVNAAPGGTGTVTVGGSSNLYSDHAIYVNYGSAAVMAGGTLAVGNDGAGLIIAQGGTVSGHGTINSATHGITDNGAVTATGGTLAITGNLSGMGTVQIASGCTLDLTSSKIGVANIGFLGTGDTLGLTAGVSGVTLDGFAMGDQIVMAGITAANWNGATDVLALSANGHLVDDVTLAGVSAGALFHVAQGGMITMTSGTQALVVSPHH